MASPVGQGEGWCESLIRQAERMGRWIRDRVVLAPGPDDECVPAERYRDPAEQRAIELGMAKLNHQR